MSRCARCDAQLDTSGVRESRDGDCTLCAAEAGDQAAIDAVVELARMGDDTAREALATGRVQA